MSGIVLVNQCYEMNNVLLMYCKAFADSLDMIFLITMNARIVHNIQCYDECELNRCIHHNYLCGRMQSMSVHSKINELLTFCYKIIIAVI